MKSSDPLLLADGTLRCRMYPAGKDTISRHLSTPCLDHRARNRPQLPLERMGTFWIVPTNAIFAVSNLQILDENILRRSGPEELGMKGLQLYQL